MFDWLYHKISIRPKNHLKWTDIIHRRNVGSKISFKLDLTEIFSSFQIQTKNVLFFPYLVCHLWRSTWWYAQWAAMSVNFDLPLQEFLSIPSWFFSPVFSRFFPCFFSSVYTTKSQLAFTSAAPAKVWQERVTDGGVRAFPLYFTSKVERGKFKKVTWPAEKHHHAFIITT